MDPLRAHRFLQRRAFLGRSARGLGAAALASLFDRALLSAAEPRASRVPKDPWPGAISPTHLPPKAKRVIFLSMAGGPSHLETFDYKPTLAELSGKPMPESFTRGQPIAQLQGKALT